MRRDLAFTENQSMSNVRFELFDPSQKTKLREGLRLCFACSICADFSAVFVLWQIQLGENNIPYGKANWTASHGHKSHRNSHNFENVG